MDAKTTAWLEGLKATNKLSSEQLAVITAAAGTPEVDEYIKGSALRQDDYSRMSNEVKAAKEAAEDAQRIYATKAQEVTTFQTNLGTWKVGADKEVLKATKAEKLAADKFALAVDKLKKLAIAQGLDEAEVLADLDAPVNGGGVNHNNQNGFDPSKYVSREDLNKLVKDATQQSTANEAFVSATLADINNEHLALYGKPLTNTRELVAGAIKSGKTLYEFAEQHLKFPDARTLATEKGIQTRITEAVEAERTKIASEAALNGGQVTGIGATFRPDLAKSSLSPVLTKSVSGAMPLPAALDQGSPTSGASAAAAAFTAGKYKAGS